MQDQFVKTVTLQNEIRDRDGYFYVGYCAELGCYVMSVLVNWTAAAYERYYRLDEDDFLSYQMNRKHFMLKYAREVGQNRDCFTERFMGSAALRDYDGAEGFQNKFPSSGPVFQGFLYHDGLLYARIVLADREIYVPPVQYLTDGKTDAERYPLRQNCYLVQTADGEPLCFRLKV